MNNIHENITLDNIQYVFKDLDPIPQFDNKIDILRIKYNDFDNLLNSYFRTIYKSKEVSKRAFSLVKILISNSPSNYAAWLIYRIHLDNDTFVNNNIDINEEQIWIDNITLKNHKNYQLWHHRKLYIEYLIKDNINEKQSKINANELSINELNIYNHEVNVLDKVFNCDRKNYHAWCHKIWLTRRFGMFKQEFELKCKEILREDEYNNSVWNYRMFLFEYVIEDIIVSESDNIYNFVKDELNFVVSSITKINNNHSSYNYLIGIIKLVKKLLDKNNKNNNKLIYSNLEITYVDLIKALMDFTKEEEEKHLSNKKDATEFLNYSYLFYKWCLDNIIYIDSTKHVFNNYDLSYIKEQLTKVLNKLISTDYIRTKYWSKMLIILNENN